MYVYSSILSSAQQQKASPSRLHLRRKSKKLPRDSPHLALPCLVLPCLSFAWLWHALSSLRRVAALLFGWVRLAAVAHISHFTTKRLKSRKQSVIGVVAIMFTKTLKKAQATTTSSGKREKAQTHTSSKHKLEA